MGVHRKALRRHTAPGLHIEPLNAAVDPRVRTGRVDLHFRAILFKVDDKLGDDPTFIYMGTWPHDEANKLAERSRLRVNPINGVLEASSVNSMVKKTARSELSCPILEAS